MLSAMIVIALAGFLVGVPIAFALGFAVILHLQLTGLVPLSLLADELYIAFDSIILVAVPLFLFTGLVMSEGGIMERIVAFSNAIVGRVRGGLAHVNVIQSVIMAGMSGSATSDAASSAVLIRAMNKSGYPPAYSAAITAVSATIGPVIPPSIPMLVYVSFADVSTGRAFLAGVVPGLGMAAVMMAINHVLATRRRFPFSPDPFSVRQLLMTGLSVLPVMLIPLAIIGGVVAGVFTATEASAIAGALAMFLAWPVYRVVTWQRLRQIALISAGMSGAIMMVVGLAKSLAWVLTRERAATWLTDAMFSLSADATTFLFLLVLILLVLGCFLDATPIMIIVLPVVIPVAKALNVDLVHMGIVVVLALMIGLLTPPVGITAMVTCSIANVRMSDLVRESWIYWIGILLVIVLVVLFPQGIMWVPNLLMPR